MCGVSRLKEPDKCLIKNSVNLKPCYGKYFNPGCCCLTVNTGNRYWVEEKVNNKFQEAAEEDKEFHGLPVVPAGV